MKADLDCFYNSIKDLGRDDLILLVVSQFQELTEMKVRQAENSRIETEIHIQYMELKDKFDELSEAFSVIAKDNARMHDQLNLKNKSIFGSHTEKFLSILNGCANLKEIEDESRVEDTEESSEAGNIISISSKKDKKSSSDKSEKKGKGKKRKPSSLKESAANLPKRVTYNFNVKTLNETYGTGWKIAFWKKYETIKVIPASEYLDVVMEPVIEVDGKYISSCYDEKLISHSLLSATLLSYILYRKFVLSLPFYRQAQDFNMRGLMLSKQTIIKWVNTIVPECLGVIRDHMLSLLTRQLYVQSDETYMLVLRDGRNPSTKGYMWVHCTSELSDANPIVSFCYEKTRSTEHLRKIFGDFTGYMTSDAYVSYSVMENESYGCFRVTGCFMHCRRYFSEALFVNDTSAIPEEQFREMPEVKALMLIGDIYRSENRLKNLTSNERLIRRQTEVLPCVDRFFAYVHELEASGEVFSDRMQSAINYAINQEKYLRRFLEDGSVPLDNGKSERHIASFSKGRANWIFADTMLGAEVNAICYTIAETAKANKANPLLYFNYLLEQVPKNISNPSEDWKDEMMPWSPSYRRYEMLQHENTLQLFEELSHTPDRPEAKKMANIDTSEAEKTAS